MKRLSRFVLVSLLSLSLVITMIPSLAFADDEVTPSSEPEVSTEAEVTEEQPVAEEEAVIEDVQEATPEEEPAVTAQDDTELPEYTGDPIETGDISEAVIDGVEDVFYGQNIDGKRHVQDMSNIRVHLNGRFLVEGVDFEVEYINNENVTTPENPAIIRFIGKGIYEGTSQDVTYNITKMIQTISAELSGTSVLCDGTPITVKVTQYGDAQGVNIGTITATTNTNLTVEDLGTTGGNTRIFKVYGLAAGTGRLTIRAEGNEYYQPSSKTYTISVGKTVKIESSNVTLGTTTYTYNGTYRKPTVTVKIGTKTLTNGTDYSVSYSNNKNAGKATVTVTGIGSTYVGTVKKSFTINKATQKIDVTVSATSFKVGKTATIKQAKSSTFTNVGEFTYTSSNNDVVTATRDKYHNCTLKGIKAGSSTITIRAAGTANLKPATKTIDVKILAIPTIKSSNVTLSKTSYVFDGKYKKPVVTVKYNKKKLVKNTDYTVTFKYNRNAGTAYAVVKGKGKYTGTVNKAFTITKASQNISVNTTNTTLSPGQTGTIKQTYATTFTNVGEFTYESTDTSVVKVKRDAYHNCTFTAVGPGTATIKIHAAATTNLKGKVKSITITVKGDSSKVSITKDMVTLSTYKFKYDGKEHYPVVTVKHDGKTLKYGTDYKYWITGETGPGEANVKLWGVGNYTGTINIKYYINK